MRLGFVVICVLCFLTNNSAQQVSNPTESSTTWNLLKYDTKQTWRSIKHSVSRPIHWKGKDFIKFGGIVVGTAMLSAADRTTSDFFRRQDEGIPQTIKDFGFYSGKPLNLLMVNAGVYGFGIFTKNEQVRKTSVLLIASTITAGYAQIIARSAFGRARPTTEKGPHNFKPFVSKEAYFSFPSGHTILAVTTAHAIAKQFENTWAKIGIYSIGSIAPLSRLTIGAHWSSDIAFGAVFSIVVVDCIDKFLFNSKAYAYSKKDKLVAWNLKFSGNQVGVIGAF